MTNLLLPLDWIVQGSFIEVLLKCLLICPVIPMLLGLLIESRWVPLGPKYQFLAFFPGNPFLAIFIATAVTFLKAQPDDALSPLGAGWNQAVLVGAFVVYVAMNIMDLTSNYTREQMASATKIYHNALYFWYGYLAAVLFADLIRAQAPFFTKLAVAGFGLLWLGCLIADNFTSKERLAVRFKTAHANNAPIWKTWRLRRLQPDYVYA